MLGQFAFCYLYFGFLLFAYFLTRRRKLKFQKSVKNNRLCEALLCEVHTQANFDQ